MWDVFEGHNDWEIIEIFQRKDTANEDHMEEVYATVLESIADKMATVIEENKIGAVSDKVQVKLGQIVTCWSSRQPESDKNEPVTTCLGVVLIILICLN